MKHFYQDIQGWASEEEQGELLKTILPLLPTTHLTIAEIGVFYGRGTALWNVELSNLERVYKYYAIDHFLGSEEHLNPDDLYSKTIINLIPIIEKVQIIKNDSISQSKIYSDNFFDIVYIDGSHNYEDVKKDIQAWLPKIKHGGILCGDDYIIGHEGVILAVNKLLGKVNFVGKQQWWKQIP